MTTPEVVVAGAGPAGLAAATSAAEAGASVLLIDEQPAPGGQLRYRAQPVPTGDETPAERPADLIERLVAAATAAGVQIRCSAAVAGAFPGNQVLIVEPDQSQIIEADVLVVATGSTDLPFTFPGATYPGVFSGRAVQIMLNQWQVRPGKRFAVIGAGAEAEELVIDILLAGGEVTWSGIAPAPFIHAHGVDGVSGLTVGREAFAVDVIAVAVGRQPDPALAILSGASMAYAPALGGLIPVLDEGLRTDVPGVFVAGDAAGVGTVAAALDEGRRAGVAAAAAMGLGNDGEVERTSEAAGAELAWRLAQRAALTPLDSAALLSGAVVNG